MTQFTGAPIFDADQHMYETADALVKHLPKRYERAVQYAQFGRQTRIVINNRVTDFIPNPTFERVVAPGAHEKFFAGMKHRGSDAAGDAGQGRRGARRHPQPAGPHRRTRPPRRPGSAELSDPRQPGRALGRRRPPTADRDHPRAQRMAGRTLVLRLRGSDLLHSNHQILRRPMYRKEIFPSTTPALLIIQRGASLATTSG
jgi:hypothetical protein